ncbi:MAG: PQQ-binding-like beta-propeller repeat protein [Thermoguttaceae bacterium]|nr:PQQ-binding-like beta-propeller repeat protein [Thermoguttaceae bacterium]
MIPRLLPVMAATVLFATVPTHAVRLLTPEAGTADRAGWPEFHGPERTNLSPETGLLARWPEGGPPLVWKVSGCGIGYANVSIAEGMLFTSGNVDDVEMVSALDLDGRTVWRSPSGPAWRRATPGSRSTPTYDDGAVYLLNPNGRVAAFDARTGRELWNVDLVERFDARGGVWGMTENLIVEDGKVYCMPGGERGRVVALDKGTSKTVWANTDIEHVAAYCSPTVITHRGVRQWISMTQRSVVSVDVETGELLWSTPFPPRAPQNALTPVYFDGHVFVASGHRTGGSLLRIADDSRDVTVVWHRHDLDNCHSGSILLDGKLFGASCRNGGKQFYCVDFLSGEDLQIDRTLGKVALTYADGMIYALGYQGTVSLLEVRPRGFEIVSQFELPQMPANTYLAHPVICGGRLYIRCDDDLCAFDIRGK